MTALSSANLGERLHMFDNLCSGCKQNEVIQTHRSLLTVYSILDLYWAIKDTYA